MKKVEQELSKKLRSEGMAIKKIAKKLQVSPGSVSLWVKNIILTEEQKSNLIKMNPIYNRQLVGASIRREDCKKKRILYQQSGKLKAKENDSNHMSGCMLYWAEGAKSRSCCSFSNSDKNMLIFFLNFLRKHFDIKNDRIKIRVNCYTGNGVSVDEIEQYWSNTLDIPKERFGKSTVDNLSKYSQKKKTKNKLVYGTISINVLKSVSVVQHIYGAIQEYNGVHDNYGLDFNP